MTTVSEFEPDMTLVLRDDSHAYIADEADTAARWNAVRRFTDDDARCVEAVVMSYKLGLTLDEFEARVAEAIEQQKVLGRLVRYARARRDER